MAVPFGNPARNGHATTSTPQQASNLVRLLESQGYRELAATYVLTGAVRLAPLLDDKRLLADQATEELEHFEALAAIYEEVASDHPEGLVAAIARRVAEVPTPRSWPEAVVAELLLCRAGKFDVAACGADLGPYARMLRRIAAEEDGHAAAAKATLQTLIAPGNRSIIQASLVEWTTIALLSFGSAAHDRTREHAKTIREYVRSLETTLSLWDLWLPPAEALGIEPPQGYPS